MNKKIIIFTVLLTNITFAYALPVEVREVSTTSESRKNSETLASMSVEALHARGLEKNAAQQKVVNSLKHDEVLSHKMAQNILKHFDEIEHHNIVSYISDAALFGKSVDLSSYETLISLVQKTTKVVLEQESLEKLEKISFENKGLVKLS
ncbi:hypothetical protein [Sulfurimonas marina]|uniref:Uncharacterized protein n=1 Tax=Sulfurimonas marina TaxID=2590551 RepID=A0A7M1AXB1_9BACT|nr:hypothetical protein [Sulfurimonas marina]QOP42083.1 hypothetical protein FJR03_10175 [Sulfurimonas marina]